MKRIYFLDTKQSAARIQGLGGKGTAVARLVLEAFRFRKRPVLSARYTESSSKEGASVEKILLELSQKKKTNTYAMEDNLGCIALYPQ